MEGLKILTAHKYETHVMCFTVSFLDGYMLLVKSKYGEEGKRFILYNCRTDQCLELRADLPMLVEMAQFVWRSKQSQEVMTDEEFVRAFGEMSAE